MLLQQLQMFTLLRYVYTCNKYIYTKFPCGTYLKTLNLDKIFLSGNISISTERDGGHGRVELSRQVYFNNF